jgi:hypothetical protein
MRRADASDEGARNRPELAARLLLRGRGPTWASVGASLDRIAAQGGPVSNIPWGNSTATVVVATSFINWSHDRDWVARMFVAYRIQPGKPMARRLARS